MIAPYFFKAKVLYCRSNRIRPGPARDKKAVYIYVKPGLKGFKHRKPPVNREIPYSKGCEYAVLWANVHSKSLTLNVYLVKDKVRDTRRGCIVSGGQELEHLPVAS